MKKIVCLAIVLVLILPVLVFAAPGFKFWKSGEQGDEVKDLQEILKEDPSIYPEGLATGYFGNLTKKAIEKLQKKFGLPETGIFDERTARIIFPCNIQITVLAPNGGENWDRNTPQEIKWQVAATTATTTPLTSTEIEKRIFWPKGRIDLIKSDGTFVKHIDTVKLTSQSYSWSIPAKILNGSDYKIRIGLWPIMPHPQLEYHPLAERWKCSSLWDESDAVFTVSGEIPPSSEKIREAIGILENVIQQLNKLLAVLQSLL